MAGMRSVGGVSVPVSSPSEVRGPRRGGGCVGGCRCEGSKVTTGTSADVR